MTLGAHLAFTAVLYLGGATLFGYQPDGISGALVAGASVLGAASSACPTWVSNRAELLRQRHHHRPLHRPQQGARRPAPGPGASTPDSVDAPSRSDPSAAVRARMAFTSAKVAPV